MFATSRKWKAVFIACCSFLTLSAQNVYFIDGYHGGIYGHYPLWNTQFYVDKLAEHPDWKINLEIEPETWDTVQVRTPEAYRNFQRIAASSQVEFVNPAYAQPYAYNISGESLIRQFEYGIKTLHKHFPDVVFTTYSSEEPCFTSCLPTILKGFGFKYATLKCPNTCWGGYTAAYGGELVNWIGPDGTSMLTVPRYACEDLEKNSTWQTTAWGNSDEYLKACKAAGIEHPVGMCLQDAGWKNGPWLGAGKKTKAGSIYQTWTEYIEKTSNGKSDDNWRVSSEDMLPSLMWGSQVMQKLAQEVRASENNIVAAEKADAMHFIQTGKAVDASRFDEAWRTLMLSQHHDSWIVPYNGLNKRHTWAQQIAEWTKNTDRIATDIIQESLTQKGNEATYIQISNISSAPRQEVVEAILPLEYSWKNYYLTDKDGKEIPTYTSVKAGKAICHFMADVPAFGFANYHVKQGKGKLTVPTFSCKSYFDVNGNYIIESDIYRIELDLSKGGTMKSLVNKKLRNKEFVDAQSPYHFNELRGYFYDQQKFRSTAENAASVSVIKNTPYTISVQIKGEIAGHPCLQTLTLHQGQARIDGNIYIDWQGNPGIGEYREEKAWAENRRTFKNDKYKLLLLLPTALEGQQLYKNAPFDVCKSKLEDTFFDTWDSHKNNIILNWVDITNQSGKYGLSLFSDHTTSYAHGKDFPLALNIQYSGKGLWGRDYPITGPTSVNYALFPHAGTWKNALVWTESTHWNEPLIVNTNTTDNVVPGKSFVSINKPGYEVTSVKVRDKDVYIRIFNAESSDSPIKVNFGFPVSKVEEVRLDGQLINTLNVNAKGQNSITLTIPQFGLSTLKVSF